MPRTWLPWRALRVLVACVALGLVVTPAALARHTLRPVGRACWMLLAAMAGALGGPQPKLLRHEDETAEVVRDDAPP